MDCGKLIELLNEYSKNIGYFNEEDLQGQTKAWILSKEFGWIEWLVENDKISYKKLLENSNFIEIKSIGWGITYSLIMLLSISDSPIDGLISYLK